MQILALLESVGLEHLAPRVDERRLAEVVVADGASSADESVFLLSSSEAAASLPSPGRGAHRSEAALVHWTESLSPGERQLLSFCRLFYHRPQFAVLDEASSSLSEEMQRHVYQRCQALGITLVSVGHRRSLLQYHSLLLQKDGDEWRFGPVDPQRPVEDGSASE